MDQRQAETRISSLVEELIAHNKNYYINNTPTISDFEFDQLLAELQALESKFPELADANSPTKRVGGDITKKFAAVKHKFPMLSLANSYSKDEIIEFETRVSKLVEGDIEYVCELKYDGCAIGIRFENGEFKQAITRGDGVQGEDVSTNVKTISSIPLKLNGENIPSHFEIRGEIFMPKKAFSTLNKQREEAGEPLFMNPRNTASGTLKMQDSRVVAERKLDCFLYGIYGDNLGIDNQYAGLIKAGEWGFKSPREADRYIAKCKNIEQVMDFINHWEKARTNLDFDIDGVVIKVNSYHHQRIIGLTSKAPRWAIAYKFKAETVTTILDEITYQVGRTGAITPVANLQPVLLAGTIVKRASLHNADQIEKLDLRIGDHVKVEKGGEIIPKVVGVDVAKRDLLSVPITYTTNCPECETLLIRKEGEAQHYCPNDTQCPPQLKGKMEHFISRRAMYIDGMGTETIEMLFQDETIQLRKISDIYKLRYDDLIRLDRMADKSVTNLLAGVEASKEIQFERVLFGLGIRYVGETVAKKLAIVFTNINNLMNASVEELVEVDEIGERIAESVVAYFNLERNNEMIQELMAAGLKFEISEEKLANRTDKLAGKTFVVSGVFSKFSRDELKQAIDQNGGKNVGSISKKTGYVIAGENMGPSKLEKAEKLEIPVISEDDFIDMIS